jgi:prepilin-type N-terminal cleavage/methylation domain-containing protein
MPIIKLDRLRERGDTIVEVLIVLAVLGLAISISYATANRSLLDNRQAIENSMATQYVQSQIESLRILGASPTSTVYTASQFCIQSGTVAASCTLPFISNSSLSIIYCGNLSASPQRFGYTGVGSPCPNNTTDTFYVTASWPDIEGGPNDQVTQVYRVHPTS